MAEPLERIWGWMASYLPESGPGFVLVLLAFAVATIGVAAVSENIKGAIKERAKEYPWTMWLLLYFLAFAVLPLTAKAPVMASLGAAATLIAALLGLVSHSPRLTALRLGVLVFLPLASMLPYPRKIDPPTELVFVSLVFAPHSDEDREKLRSYSNSFQQLLAATFGGAVEIHPEVFDSADADSWIYPAAENKIKSSRINPILVLRNTARTDRHPELPEWIRVSTSLHAYEGERLKKKAIERLRFEGPRQDLKFVFLRAAHDLLKKTEKIEGLQLDEGSQEAIKSSLLHEYRDFVALAGRDDLAQQIDVLSGLSPIPNDQLEEALLSYELPERSEKYDERRKRLGNASLSLLEDM